MAAPKTVSSSAPTEASDEAPVWPGAHTAHTKLAAYLEGLKVELASVLQRGADNKKDVETEIARVEHEIAALLKGKPLETAVNKPTVETA